MSFKSLPECWGHRGASLAFPENTLASFEAAIRDGAEGIESDVHVSRDNVVLMFHDPDLRRTTNSSGKIKERDWFGVDGMEHVRTVKEPVQAIPTFAETVALLMQPGNQHVKFNVDIKPNNEPERLFKLINEIISAQPNWETALAPRILLGLWHSSFLEPAKRLLPYCRRSHITESLYLSRTYFWQDADVFSVSFSVLASADGEKFRNECKQAGKELLVWTVNSPEQMIEAARWGVNSILTDVTKVWLELRARLQEDFDSHASQYGRAFLWMAMEYYWPMRAFRTMASTRVLESIAGPFDIHRPEIINV